MLHTHRSTAGRRRTPTVAAWAAAAITMLLLGSCGVEAVDDASGSADRTTSTPAEGNDTTTAPDDDGSSDDTADPSDDDGDTTDGDADADADAETDDETPTTGDNTIGDEDDMIREALIEGFVSAGLTTEQATCLADGYMDLGITDPDSSADLDITAMMSMFTECGVSMEDLAGLGSGLGA